MSSPVPKGATRSVGQFEKLAKVGEGTYGSVYKARDRQSGSVVALKQVKILNSREGFPVSRLRTAPHAKYRAGPTRTTPARAAPD